ncbi:MAG: DUF1707 SHOCT-like domain-containing protein [Acidimicrobiales bacterium]
MSGIGGSGFDLVDGHVYSPPRGRFRHRGAVRASDADREAAADELRRHYASGRLDLDELGDRLSGAYAARTHSALDSLFADLPAGPTANLLPADAAQPKPAPRRRPTLVRAFGLWALAVIALALFASNLNALGIALAVLFLAIAFWCLVAWSLSRFLRSHPVLRTVYEATRHWSRHRSRW